MKKFLMSLFATIVIITAGQISFASQLNYAHLSDIHIYELNDEGGEPTAQEVLLKNSLSDINKIPKLDFLIVTGDTIDYSDRELFRHTLRIFNNLSIPWYYTLGNHECFYSDEIVLKNELIQIVKEINKNYKFDKRYYSFKPKRGFTIVGLDGIQPQDTDKNTGLGYIDKEQLAFLDGTLANSGNDTVIIFMHTPLYPPMDMSDHLMDNADEVYAVLNKYPERAIAIFAGHYHSINVTEKNNILHVATPSLRYSQAYRVVNVRNKFKKAVFTLQYKETTEPNLSDEIRGEYTEKDRNTTVTLVRKGNSKLKKVISLI